MARLDRSTTASLAILGVPTLAVLLFTWFDRLHRGRAQQEQGAGGREDRRRLGDHDELPIALGGFKAAGVDVRAFMGRPDCVPDVHAFQSPAICPMAALSRFQTLMPAMARISAASCFSS
jgi:hypothetical protein